MTRSLSGPATVLKGLLACTSALVALPLLALPAQAQETEDPYELPPLILRQQLQYTGAVDGYLAPATETGVKSGVPLSEVPQSISVVTSKELEARSPTQVEEAISYTAGITPSTWGTDDRFDQFAIRGFDMGSNALYRDGLPQKVLSFSAFTTDPYMLDRIDVLRGPAGVLYGSNDAGGMVNLVSKRPVFGHQASAYVGYGSNETAEAGFDVSGTLDGAGTLAGRLTGLIRDGETEVDHSANDRRFLSGSITWAPTDDTSITLMAHTQKDELTPIIMRPIAGEDYDRSWGKLSDSYAYKQSEYNHFETEQYSLGWEVKHRFGEGFTFNSRLRYAHQETDYAQLDYDSADASGLHYYAFRNDEEAETLGFDNNLEWQSTFGGGAENSLIVGFDYQRSEIEVTQYYDGSLYTVPYSSASLDFPVEDPPRSARDRTTYTEKGIYLQDHVKFANGTAVTAGLRHSWFENETENLLGSGSSDQDDEATTGMIGVSHDFGNGLTPYLSYTEGFIQNVGKTINGSTLKPSRSRQWETGVRYTNGDMLLSAALFDLRKTNVKEYDLSDPTWSSFTQSGEVRSRGVELEARGRLSDTLSGVAGYTYLDTEITDSSDDSLEGNENALAPNHQISLWLDWDADVLLPGLRIGGGVRYVSEFYATQDNARETDGYTLADLAVSYDMGDYDMNLGVSNLFDHDYDGICYDYYGCSKGQGRKVTFKLERTF